MSCQKPRRGIRIDNSIHTINIPACPGCLLVGVDPNRGNEETVRSPGMLWPANGIADNFSGALPV